MNIKQLHALVNNQREKSGLSPISDTEFLAQITEIQLKGKIKIKDGEVKPVDKENYCESN